MFKSEVVGDLKAASNSGANGDADSETEYYSGRKEEVDRETKSKAYALCREFLSGTWKIISEEDFQISIVSGGLSNLLYLCSLPSCVQCLGEEPRQVVLRVYGAILQGAESLVLESVMFALLAERALGPRLYGVFPEGRLEQYLPSCCLVTEQLSVPELSAEIAAKMACFHGMVMPFNKEPKWLFQTIDRYMDRVLGLKFLRSAHVNKFNRLMKYNLEAELDNLRTLLTATASPVVFCHNDVQEGNILLLNVQGPSPLAGSCSLTLSTAATTTGGFDLGNHFCEWMYDYTHDQWPFFKANMENYPTREQQLHFIRSYLSESGGYAEAVDPEGRAKIEEQMITEANRYALASHFLWGLWSIIQAKISTIEFGYMDYAQSRFDTYFKQKKLFT